MIFNPRRPKGPISVVRNFVDFVFIDFRNANLVFLLLSEAELKPQKM
jgi:hypothetical protein